MTTTVELIEQQVRRHPERTAVICGDARLTYRQLWAGAGAVARELTARGVAPGATVAVLGPGNERFMTAVLGAWLAGMSWTPVDAAWPAQRQRHVLEDTGAPAVLDTGTGGGQGPDGPAGVPTVDVAALTADDAAPAEPVHRPGGDDPAYVIYTSGSTGAPKGVCVEHRPLAAHLTGAVEAYGLAGDDVLLSFSAPAFDATVMEMWVGLVEGGTVVLRGRALWTGPQLFERVRRHGVTYVGCTTAYFETFFGEELPPSQQEALSGLRGIFFGGEAPSAAVLHRWANGPLGHVPLCNGYGPTEAVIAATRYWIRQGWDGGDRVPIGTCVPGHEAVVLDEDGRPVAEGATGELYLGGVCVARGYLNRPDLTARRFVRLPGRSGVHYRTGDLVTRKDGQLYFVGRVDRQVKIRGFRIEPEEIEVVLRGLAGVRGAVVGVGSGSAGRTRLEAHVVPDGAVDSAAFAASVRTALGERLPAYMVPETVEVHEELPLGGTGKVDRAKVLAGAEHA
ncbi:amino acid adenylation domain-containing protein [Streptomyces xiaopingdaonensis]|uniref:amino acid adenylation domain-containing protein n=1 Tax=Streptomyces xiaopingdaonensis TaxID=1565415 RepID=UPI0002D35C09|nr:amino acid adenylation domain-containing protein [Streptomyces xiaopingdaonensis]